jgi:hypothetical protein
MRSVQEEKNISKGNTIVAGIDWSYSTKAADAASSSSSSKKKPRLS